MKNLLFVILVLTILSCSEPMSIENQWQGKVDIGQREVPFNFSLERNGDKWLAHFRNGDEVLTMDEVLVTEDSIHIKMGIFDAELHAAILSDRLSGLYYRKFAGDYTLPFVAMISSNRFDMARGKSCDFSGKWKVIFTEEDGSTYDAIGYFEEEDSYLTGTFRTETGDYRFLEGVADSCEMKLSVFDGSHVFLFEAVQQSDGTLQGHFWSGKHYHASWTAERNETYELANPDSLTFLKEVDDKLAFSFPNTTGDYVSLADFEGKPTIVQLLGTWCPNCMDETIFLTNWLSQNPENDLQIIGLAFEYNDATYAKARVVKLKEKLDVPYPILIAGNENKIEAGKALPMLNKVVSFPTLIFLDKHHDIKRIHTGFNGPSTGKRYEDFKIEFEETVTEISLSE